MAKASGWELLQAKRYKAALARLREEHAKDGSDGLRNNMAITYLCMGDFESARVIFDDLLKGESSEAGSAAFAYAGLVRWLMGDVRDAINHWKGGLDCKYSDGAGGMELPLLLYYAGVRHPESYPLGNAKKLITQRLKSGWSRNWPGAIGRFLVGRIDEKQMRKLARFEIELVEIQQMTQADFYVGVECIRLGNQNEFYERMNRCSIQANCEILYEPFLAQNEVKSQRK